jgi:hypothetical protein
MIITIINDKPRLVDVNNYKDCVVLCIVIFYLK